MFVKWFDICELKIKTKTIHTQNNPETFGVTQDYALTLGTYLDNKENFTETLLWDHKETTFVLIQDDKMSKPHHTKQNYQNWKSNNQIQ